MSVIAVVALPTDPLEALRELALCNSELDRLRREAVEAAREQGASWEQVGAALGMTRQSAWEFYTRSLRQDLERSAARKPTLDEDEAMVLAVEGVRAVRQARRRT